MTIDIVTKLEETKLVGGYMGYDTKCPKCQHINRAEKLLRPVSYVECCRNGTCSCEYLVQFDSDEAASDRQLHRALYPTKGDAR